MSVPVLPAARMLLELGAGPAAHAARPEQAAAPARCDACRLQEQVQLAAQTAHAHGLAEGIERGMAELAARTSRIEERLRAEHAASLAALSGEMLDRLDRELARVHADIGESGAQVLAAWLGERVRGEALDALAAQLGRLLADKAGARVLVRGPAALIDQLLPRIDGAPHTIVVEHSDACDVSVTIDQQVLETAIGAWISRLEVAA